MKTRSFLFLIPTLAIMAPANFSAILVGPVAARSVADAFTAAGPTGNLGNNNYGGGGALGLAASALPNGEFQTVLRFDLASTRASLDAEYGAGQWSIQSVSLQLSSSPHNNAIYNEIAAGTFGVSWMQNNSWVEGTGNAGNPSANGLTYNTLQSSFINPTADEALGTFSFNGGSSGLNNYSLTLSPGLVSAIMSGNQASLRMFAADNQVSYLFSSRAATLEENRPSLIITPVPEPSSIALAGLGIAACLWRFRRNSR